MSEVTKFYPLPRLKVFVNDITALLKGRNEELAEMAEKVLEKLRDKVEEKGLELSITEGGKEGESKVITSCEFWEEMLRECKQKRGDARGGPENIN